MDTLDTSWRPPMAVNSEQIIGKGPGWLQVLCLIELFPDLTNFFEISFTESFAASRNPIYKSRYLFFFAQMVDVTERVHKKYRISKTISMIFCFPFSLTLRHY
jgi:hypothetical protein